MRRLPDATYPKLWTAWAGAGAVWFGLLEASALTQPRSGRDTLSQNLKHLTRTRPRKAVAGAAWLLFALWFFDHIILTDNPRV